MTEKSASASASGSKKKDTITLSVSMMGKVRDVKVPRGTKLFDALKAADININLAGCILRLNGRALKGLDKELEDPVLEEDAGLVITEMIRGG